MFEEKIWKVSQPTDVIVLPEMFTTGFSMNAASLAESMNLETFKWMKQMATQTGALILGSYIVREKTNFYNRMLWMEPGGKYETYDKRHLFRMANEHEVYSGGKHRLVASWRGWNICPLVCYDLRFPVWSRNTWNASTKQMAYDVVVYVANWPKARVDAWDALLKARAIENLSYAVGVNRTGADQLGIEYNGHSAVIDPRGTTTYFAEEGEGIETVVLKGEQLEAHRERFPAYLDADAFRLS